MSIRKYSKSALWIVLGITLVCSQPVWGANYRLISLARDGELAGHAMDINDANVVTGYCTVPPKVPGGLVHKGFVWDGEGFEDIAPLATHVAEDENLSYTKCSAINQDGLVAGESGYSNATGDDSKAFLKTADSMAYPAALNGAVKSQAHGINASGHVCGQSGSHAALWKEGELSSLIPQGSSQSVAWGMNDSGVVVGEALMPQGKRAFKKDADGISELASLGGMSASTARAVNSSGSIAGTIQMYGFQDVAVIWNGETVQQLPALGMMMNCEGLAINDAGQVVGKAVLPGSGYPPKYSAVLWKDTIINLQHQVSPATRAEWSLTCATAINANGWITGYGTCKGVEAAFVLKPETSQSVSGTVTTDIPGYQLALEGVTAQLEGTGLSVQSGADGSFVIPGVPVGDYTLVLSGKGLKTKKIPVTLNEADDRVISDSDGKLVAGLSGDSDGSSRLDMKDAHSSLTGAAGL